MLKGEAKTAYMREYMRRRRSGQPPPPKKPWKPSKGLVRNIAWAVRNRHRLRSGTRLANAINGLAFDTDEEWLEACYRWKARCRSNPIPDEDAATEVPAARSEPSRTSPELSCSFCGKPKSDVRLLVGNEFNHICNECIDKCASISSSSLDVPSI